MTPAYRIIADQQDITAIIRDRLISLHVTDKTGLVSDTAETTLDDRNSAIEIPRTGALLEIYMGYQETGLYRMGSYTVDEVELTGPPNTMRIRAKAADMRQSLKSCKLRSWDDITLGDLVATIAAEHGLIPRVGEFLDAIHIPHLDQTYESDMHLLTRLAKQYDADAKPVDGRLVFVKKGTAKSVSGQSFDVIDIDIEQVSYWLNTANMPVSLPTTEIPNRPRISLSMLAKAIPHSISETIFQIERPSRSPPKHVSTKTPVAFVPYH